MRGATITVDPQSGDPAQRVPVIARSHGAELGARFERDTFNVSLAAFWLDLASELVFGGDSGTTEPNAASRRLGIELSGFWRPAPWLTVDGAAAWTHARFRDVPADQRYIPNATPFVFGGGVSAAVGGGTTLTLRARHFAGAPLIEDNSHRSAPTTLVNAGAYWERGRVRIGVDVLNLLNSEDNDITYWYASRLPGEPAEGVEDTHIHPVEPRQVRAVVRLVF